MRSLRAPPPAASASPEPSVGEKQPRHQSGPCPPPSHSSAEIKTTPSAKNSFSSPPSSFPLTKASRFHWFPPFSPTLSPTQPAQVRTKHSESHPRATQWVASGSPLSPEAQSPLPKSSEWTPQFGTFQVHLGRGFINIVPHPPSSLAMRFPRLTKSWDRIFSCPQIQPQQQQHNHSSTQIRVKQILFS